MRPYRFVTAVGVLALLILLPLQSASGALIGAWTFEDGEELVDKAGNFPDLQLMGDASVHGGFLDVNGGGTVSTGWAVTVGDYMGPTITNKTLVSWLTLESLADGASAGSAITIDRKASDVFDGIIFSERETNRWMNGSNGHSRSVPDFSPGFEETAAGELIQVAITYEDLGGGSVRITGYRNTVDQVTGQVTGGQQIGQRDDDPLGTWDPMDTEVFFGKRHGDPNNPVPGGLDALIAEAHIYDHVLTEQEIQGLEMGAEIQDPFPPAEPTLLHQWTFNGFTAEDSVGNANATLRNGANFTTADNRDQGVALDGIDDYVDTARLVHTIEAKTLVSWVTLANRDAAQNGGSALSVQNFPTGRFDGIVFGERTDDQWMAGSDNWQRSPRDNGGALETTSPPAEVMMAIAYDTDNSITIYRDGELYAGPYTPVDSELQSYYGKDTNAIFGNRIQGFGHLEGFINEARVYGYALDGAEVQTLYQEGPMPPEPAKMAHQWTFNDGAGVDLAGDAHGTLGNGAMLDVREINGEDSGGLALDGIDDFMITDALGETIGPKTLISWVTLDDAFQPGGGSALTIEASNGSIFDGIIFAERVEGQWMAGSDFHRRTPVDNGGLPETESPPDEVMMAIVYDGDNSITIYRNGELYADTYTQQQLQIYAGADSVAMFGRRHGTAAAGPGALAGFINEARIYNAPLDAVTIAEIYNEGPAPGFFIPPEPGMVHQWTFNDGTAADSIGSAHGELLGGASIVLEGNGGKLSLDGIDDVVITEAIDATIGEKTLVAWVTLDNAEQQGGSALTLQLENGSVFDGIVFAEVDPGMWMNGSNNHERTDNMSFGWVEDESPPDEVMIAIVYDGFGGITIWRNDEMYDPLYWLGNLQSYPAQVSNAILGRRHTGSGANSYLAGLINEARIYNYALTELEIPALFQEGPVTGMPMIWDGLGDGEWGAMDAGFSRWVDPQDNSLTGLPDADTDAIIRTDVVTIVQAREAQSVSAQSGGLVIADGASLQVSRSVQFPEGTTLALGAGATLTAAKESSVHTLSAADGARIDGDLVLTGAVSMDGPGATLNVDGTVEFAPQAAYICKLVGDQSDTLAARSDVELVLDNALELEFAGGDDAFKAGTYTLLTSTHGEDGIIRKFTFDNNLGQYVSDDPADDREAGLKYTRKELTLTIDYDLHSGDANLDTVTDVRDFNLWNANKFTGDTDWAKGDFNNDGLTDVRDFNLWNANKFTSARDGAPVAEGQVPEPGTLALLAGGLLGIALIRYRRR